MDMGFKLASSSYFKKNVNIGQHSGLQPLTTMSE